MKTALKEHVKLSPLDTSKDLVIWTDAAPGEGMCYVLAQCTMGQMIGSKGNKY